MRSQTHLADKHDGILHKRKPPHNPASAVTGAHSVPQVEACWKTSVRRRLPTSYLEIRAWERVRVPWIINGTPVGYIYIYYVCVPVQLTDRQNQSLRRNPPSPHHQLKSLSSSSLVGRNCVCVMRVLQLNRRNTLVFGEGKKSVELLAQSLEKMPFPQWLWRPTWS